MNSARLLPLLVAHRLLAECTLCPNMIGPVVHGPALETPLFLLGQAPGPHEGKIGKPFAWTAGKTLFRWFQEHLGVTEIAIREHVYFAAVARCFPGKAKGGGDRKPDKDEMHNCRAHLQREVAALAPQVVIPVGQLAIEQVLGRKAPLAETIGLQFRTEYLGARVDVVPLPHPSGVSTWHRTPQGQALLARAFELLAQHPAVQQTLL